MSVYNNQIVEATLLEWPQTRNDDKVLILKVWEKCGLYLTDEQRRKFLDAPTAETIRRTRQKLQQHGRYLPWKPVAAARKELAEGVRYSVTSHYGPGVARITIEQAKEAVDQATLFDTKSLRRFT